jgi:hypothetical protein
MTLFLPFIFFFKNQKRGAAKGYYLKTLYMKERKYKTKGGGHKPKPPRH